MKSATTANDWRAAYKQAYEENFKVEYPTAYKDHGLPIIKFPEVNTSNGLTRAIINFLSWKGHYGNRINTMGRKIEKKYTTGAGKVYTEEKWIPGSTARGSSDVNAILAGRAVHIEIKIGRDTQKEDQKKQQAKVERAGGVYVIMKTIEQFFEWYNAFVNHPSDR